MSNVPPATVRSRAELRTLQRAMFAALAQPLTADDRLARRGRGGGDLRVLARRLIKPNDRLNSVERLEIYARCYWFRLIDCVYEDSPGLRALLGDARFGRLVQAYLSRCPSRSFTLRNLCARLAAFVRAEPRWTAPDTALAHAVARFEGAQTVAFDAAARPPLRRREIEAVGAGRTRVALQPHLTLLALDWAVDDFVLAVKRRAESQPQASHAVEPRASRGRRKRDPQARPQPGRVYLAVHRHGLDIYYKRLDAGAFAVLSALGAGRTLPQALARARPADAEQIRGWFRTWMSLGWLCRRE